MNIVFLGSGGGGNLKFIHGYFEGATSIKVSGVITDRVCGASKYANQHNIKSAILTFDRNEESDMELINIIEAINADIIVTNIHKILSKRIINAFGSKLINLHYSYLPAFQGTIGMAPVDEAMNRNNAFIGTTTHFLTEKVDDGNVITQGIFSRYGVSNAYQKTFECGALTLLSSIYSFLEEEMVGYRDFDTIRVSPSSDSIDKERCISILKGLQ